MTNKTSQKIEEGTLYVLQDTRDNKIIKGYVNEGIFRYWEVNPSNWWESISQDYYAEDYTIIERINNGGLRQLN